MNDLKQSEEYLELMRLIEGVGRGILRFLERPENWCYTDHLMALNPGDNMFIVLYQLYEAINVDVWLRDLDQVKDRDYTFAAALQWAWKQLKEAKS